MAVEKLLDDLNQPYRSVRLGEVVLASPKLSKEAQEKLSGELQNIGFALIDDKKGKIIEKIRTKIIELVHRSQGQTVNKLSVVLAEELNYDYNYLSNLFSSIEGITIEHYYIQQRIERVKELIVYNELTLSEIANQLGYSSVAYLSSQFKKVTGFTPSQFKKLQDNSLRKPLDKL